MHNMGKEEITKFLFQFEVIFYPVKICLSLVSIRLLYLHCISNGYPAILPQAFDLYSEIIHKISFKFNEILLEFSQWVCVAFPQGSLARNC